MKNILAVIYNKKNSNIIAAVAIICSALLLIGAFYYPFIKSTFSVDFPDWIPNWFSLHDELEEWIVKKGKIPVGNQYLLGIIKSLFADGSFFLGIIIFLFSVVFPMLKIVLCAVALISFQKTDAKDKIIKAIGYVSKWSMADVFIVAVIIVMFKAKGFNFKFTAEPGIYFYAISAILSSLAILLIMRQFESERA
ncbi:MAG: paraquat-inducible protein A [Thermodesulfobacteriota bacterium]